LPSSFSGDLCCPHHTLILQVFVSTDGITILVHRRAFSCRGYKHPFFQTKVFFLLVFFPRSSANPPQNIDHQLVVEGTFQCEGSSKQEEEEEEEAEPEPEEPA
jgi:hypothetical protein